jgi:Pentapeptide repeats (8 copies)
VDGPTDGPKGRTTATFVVECYWPGIDEAQVRDVLTRVTQPRPGAAASRRAVPAHLDGANLKGATMAEAHLNGADLKGANLTGAGLLFAHLNGAHLGAANLVGANLRGAHLVGADLTRTDFNGADLTGAFWPADVAVPKGWQRDTGSGRVKRADTNSGGAASE